jgi:PKD repeat protein
MTGPLVVEWLADYRLVTPGYPVAFTALIEGRTTLSVWEFGDGDVATNQPYVPHRWTQAGDYRVALWAFNESSPGGVSATGMVHVAVQPVLYVAAASTNPQPPYTSWDTAARNIQDAVDTTVAGAEILVTNGVYAEGVAVTNPLTLLSVNGPQFTVINGGGAVR